MTEQLLTLDDVAKILQVSVVTVRRLINDGALKAIKVRGQLRVKQEDLDAYLRRQ
jgi:excisionase family DNA binding protein